MTLSGSDMDSFEIDGTELFLKAGVTLDYETQNTYKVKVSVDDVSIGKTPDATSNLFKLKITDVSPEIINGTPGNDADLTGGDDSDQISGFDGMDVLNGGKGEDELDGGAGDDTLTGGRSQDVLTGGADADTFVFTSRQDSKVGPDDRDTITDFDPSEDMIDLSQIDAKKGGADDAFNWVGDEKLKKKGDLRYVDKGTHVLVEGDVDGDKKADFQIKVDGLNMLSEDDFIL